MESELQRKRNINVVGMPISTKRRNCIDVHFNTLKSGGRAYSSFTHRYINDYYSVYLSVVFFPFFFFFVAAAAASSSSFSSSLNKMLCVEFHTVSSLYPCCVLCLSVRNFEIVLWETDGLVPIIKQTNYFIYFAFL